MNQVRPWALNPGGIPIPDPKKLGVLYHKRTRSPCGAGMCTAVQFIKQPESDQFNQGPEGPQSKARNQVETSNCRVKKQPGQSQQTSTDKVPAGWEIILEKVCADSLKSQDPKSLDTNRRIWKASQNQKQSTNPLEKGSRAKSGYRKSAETTVPVQKPSATFLASRAPHHASCLANFMLIQSHDQVLKHRTHERGTL